MCEREGVCECVRECECECEYVDVTGVSASFRISYSWPGMMEIYYLSITRDVLILYFKYPVLTTL